MLVERIGTSYVRYVLKSLIRFDWPNATANRNRPPHAVPLLPDGMRAEAPSDDTQSELILLASSASFQPQA